MAGFVHMIGQVVGPFDGVLVVRMLLTLVLCGLIGIERSTRERASGFRPHILVGLGACLLTLAGAYGFADLPGTGAHPDPTRIASYVVSGIGFLGAGAILRHGTTVRRLTTAATLWGAASIGIARGAGLGGWRHCSGHSASLKHGRNWTRRLTGGGTLSCLPTTMRRTSSS